MVDEKLATGEYHLEYIIGYLTVLATAYLVTCGV